VQSNSVVNESVLLRQKIDHLERHCAGEGAIMGAAGRIPLGVASIDDLLGGGLETGRMHEIGGEPGSTGAATGFLAGLLLRALSVAGMPGPMMVWIMQDLCGVEGGGLHGPGLAALGLDPSRLIIVHAAKPREALWAMEECLRCGALAAVILELWGTPRDFDLVAMRRLSLAAEKGRAAGFLLRQGAGTAGFTTRWHIGPAQSQPPPSSLVEKPATRESRGSAFLPLQVPGLPAFDVALTRNRLGATGRWTLCFNPMTHAFSEESGHETGRAANTDNPADATAGVSRGGPTVIWPPLSGNLVSHAANRPAVPQQNVAAGEIRGGDMRHAG
jgi:protein ImuA